MRTPSLTTLVHVGRVLCCQAFLLIVLVDALPAQTSPSAAESYLAGKRAFDDRNYAEAIRLLTTALQSTKEKTVLLNSLFFRGRAYKQMGNCELAREDLDIMVEIGRDSIDSQTLQIANRIISECSSAPSPERPGESESAPPSEAKQKLPFSAEPPTPAQQPARQQTVIMWEDESPRRRTVGLVISLGTFFPTGVLGEASDGGPGMSVVLLVPIGNLYLSLGLETAAFEVYSYDPRADEGYFDSYGAATDLSTYSIAAGLQIDFGAVRKSSVVPYLRADVGYATGGSDFSFSDFYRFYYDSEEPLGGLEESDQALTFAFGGGVNLKLTNVLAIPAGVEFRNIEYSGEGGESFGYVVLKAGLRISF